MNIPENILQTVADAAFQNAPHTHNHLIARKIGLGITWEDQSQARLTHAQLRNIAKKHNVPRGRNTPDTVANLRKAGIKF